MIIGIVVAQATATDSTLVRAIALAVAFIVAAVVVGRSATAKVVLDEETATVSRFRRAILQRSETRGFVIGVERSFGWPGTTRVVAMTTNPMGRPICRVPGQPRSDIDAFVMELNSWVGTLNAVVGEPDTDLQPSFADITDRLAARPKASPGEGGPAHP